MGGTPSPAPGPSPTAPVPPDFIDAARAVATALRQFAEKAHTYQDTRNRQARQMMTAPGDWKGTYATKYVSDSASQAGALTTASDAATGYAGQLGGV